MKQVSSNKPAMLALLLVMTSLLLASCGGQEEVAEEPAKVSFVGEIEEINSFVALVADEPQDPEEAREVRAYLCDGNLINDWFKSSVAGEELDLSSDNETRLEGQLADDIATGTFTSANGDSVPFEAFPATGIAGLYNVTLSDDGTLSGSSELGGKVEGELGDQLEDGSYPVSGTIIPPDDEEQQDFEAFIDDDTPRELRWIVLSDGQIRGGPFGGGGGGFNFQGGGFNLQGTGFNFQGGNFQGGFNFQGGINLQGGFNQQGVGGFNLQGGGGNLQGGGFNQPGGGGFNLQGGGVNLQGGGFNLPGGGTPQSGASPQGGDGQPGGGNGKASDSGGDAGTKAADDATSGDGGLNFASSGGGGGGDGGDGKGKGGGKGGGKGKGN